MYSHFSLPVFLCGMMIMLNIESHAFDSLRVEKHNGAKFIVHQVEQGETLFALSRRYQCPIEDIKKYNESIDNNGLKMFDEVLIPLSRNKKKRKAKQQDRKEKTSSEYHIVLSGETLYSISRKYQMTVDSLKAINALTSNEIGLNDTLQLVRLDQKLTNQTPKPKEKVAESKPESSNTQANDQSKFHVVKPSETLFAIAKTYALSLDSLVKWNNLENYNLDIGQKIYVQNNVHDNLEVPIPKRADSIKITPPKQALDTIYVKTDESEFRTKTNEIDGQVWVTEEGFAMRIADTEFTTKLLALHRTAPVGSLVKLKNHMNGKQVEVRVVGTLPNVALNRNVLLRISEAAYNELGGLDFKLPVTSSYVEQ